MPISNPTQLVDEFKKSGEFDRLRRELLNQFRHSDAMNPFMARVEDIARQRLNSDTKLLYMSQESVHRELMQEMDRYPLVERAVADVRLFTDPAFVEGIRTSAGKILRADRGQMSPASSKYAEAITKPGPSVSSTPSQERTQNENGLPEVHQAISSGMSAAISQGTLSTRRPSAPTISPTVQASPDKSPTTTVNEVGRSMHVSSDDKA